MKLLDLRPDRALLKVDFAGYKLSLEPVPVLRTDLPVSSRPDRVRPGADQYSCLDAQLFGLQNHLVRDPWVVGSCYFLDGGWTVRRVVYDEASGRLKPVSSVFKVGRKRERREGDYNCSMRFLSERYALIGDGQGGLRLVETGDRRRGDEWKGRFVFPAVDGMEEGFVVLDGRFEVAGGGERHVHAVCGSVRRTEEDGFETVLHWVKAIQEEGGSGEWKYHSVKVLRGRGFPVYCALELKSRGLVLASDKPFKFVLDSENPIVEKEVVPELKKPEAEGEREPVEVNFEWSQTLEDISVKVPKEEGFSYKVTNENMKLKVHRNEALIIDGESFFAAIDAELTSWTNEQSELQITLFKSQPGVMWPFLFPGCPEETNANRAEGEDLPPVSNLTSQLEECDFGIVGSGEETEYTLERFDATSHAVTHKTFLGGNGPLFSLPLRPEFPPAIALRHDVDACLWLQQPGDEWSLRHEGTLHAFGYVQASKQQRKFLSCSPDLSYALICEAERHIFIYKASYGAEGLRHRNGPQVSIGQQKLVSLEGSGEIIGLCAENDCAILLTESHVLVLQLRIEE
ncbi:nudC domain-containing protein 1 [Culex pipiens pallens]|uniref:nudC domain-containing protein 1 n=1 Tax=Culex pipiens pallens TaxID=42434 RepID=UPI00195460B1|nr:nudC domain-containing protein 1 [Culex pipiens pallens]